MRVASKAASSARAARMVRSTPSSPRTRLSSSLGHRRASSSSARTSAHVSARSPWTNSAPSSTACGAHVRSVQTRPPTRSRASSTIARRPASCRSRAALRPATPAPRTRTSASTERPLSAAARRAAAVWRLRSAGRRRSGRGGRRGGRDRVVQPRRAARPRRSRRWPARGRPLRRARRRPPPAVAAGWRPDDRGPRGPGLACRGPSPAGPRRSPGDQDRAVASPGFGVVVLDDRERLQAAVELHGDRRVGQLARQDALGVLARGHHVGVAVVAHEHAARVPALHAQLRAPAPSAPCTGRWRCRGAGNRGERRSRRRRATPPRGRGCGSE